VWNLAEERADAVRDAADPEKLTNAARIAVIPSCRIGLLGVSAMFRRAFAYLAAQHVRRLQNPAGEKQRSAVTKGN
jgi:hypothetical protein